PTHGQASHPRDDVPLFRGRRDCAWAKFDRAPVEIERRAVDAGRAREVVRIEGASHRQHEGSLLLERGLVRDLRGQERKLRLVAVVGTVEKQLAILVELPGKRTDDVEALARIEDGGGAVAVAAALIPVSAAGGWER